MTDLAPLSLVTLGVEWTRPLGLLALALPLIVLLWSLRRAPSLEEPTGAFRLWQELAAAKQQSTARSRRGLPPGLAWLLFALAAASLGSAGPRSSRAPRLERWEVVLDRSPSMFLPLEPDGGEARLRGAVRDAEAWLAQRGVDPELCTWIDSASGARRSRAELPALLEEPLVAEAEPAWERFDAPGQLLVTDRAPGPGLEHASWVAVGGAAIPGLVDRGLSWDGEELVETPASTPERVLTDGLPVELEQLVEIWSSARGLASGGAAQGPVALRVEAVGTAGQGERRVGRDGWWILGDWSRPEGESARELSAWLPERQVVWEPGRVLVGLTEVSELGGDLGSMAASWATLFDRALSKHAGVAPLAERRAAGAPMERTGTAPEAKHGAPDERPIESWLLMLASASAAIWFLRQRRT